MKYRNHFVTVLIVKYLSDRTEKCVLKVHDYSPLHPMFLSLAFYSPLCHVFLFIERWVSLVGIFAPQETFGNVWRHFWLLTLGVGRVLLASVGKGQGCCQTFY